MVDHMQSAMDCLGGNGRYQKLLIAFLAVTWFQITYVVLGVPFIFMNPVFICNGEEVREATACKNIKQCYLQNDFTLTAYAQLYCDKQIDRDIIQSFLSIGSILGLLIMNMISDIKGRKFAFISALIVSEIGIALTTIGAYTHSVALMAGAQILNGFGGYSSMIIGYVLISDVCSGKLKSMAIIAMNGFWGVAEMSFCLFYYVIPEWYNFLIVIEFIPLLGCIAMCCFVLVQSPMFLAYKKRDEAKCMKALQTIAMFNSKQEMDICEARKHVRMAIQSQIAAAQNKSSESPFRTLLCNITHIKAVILIAVIQISTNMYYYGIQYSLQSLGSNFGIDILLAGTFETFAYFSINLFIGKLERRKGLFITNLASFILGSLFVFTFIQENKVVASIVLCLCRMVNTYSQGFIPLLQTESFPGKIISTGAGTIEGISQLGSFLTPFIVSLVKNLGGNPIVILSFVVLVLGILPIKFVKQTFNPHQPGTKLALLQSGEAIEESEIEGK